MQIFIYPSQDVLNNVVAQLSDAAKDGALVAEQSDGTFQLSIDDQYANQITMADPTTPGVPALKDYAGAKRWDIENRNITVSGHPIKTDADSQRKTANLDWDFQTGAQTGTCQYKCSDETFVVADAALIHSFYLGIQAHIKDCYDAEGAASTAIVAGSCKTFDQVDAFFAGIP